MSKYVVAIVTGLAVAFVVSFALSALMGGHGGGTPFITGALLGTFTAYIMANLAGNRKVATALEAARQQALALTPAPGKALLCVYREGFVGKAAGLNVFVDGRPVAQLTSPRFTCLALTAGRHRISAAFGGLAGAQNREGAIEADVAAGDVVAVRIGVSMGLMQNTVTLVRQPDPVAAAQALRQVQMTVPDLAEV